MASHRLLLESLPVSPNISRLRAEGNITADMTSVWIGFGAIELKREVRLEHRRFPNGGSWSFFLCPRCNRRVRRLIPVLVEADSRGGIPESAEF
jgi:hypothetical protein